MAEVFQQALAGQPPVQKTPFDLALEELMKQQQTPKPMFTPQQQRERVLRNNAMVDMGLLGQMSGDQQIGNVGGQVFKQALGDRATRFTDRGMTDTLTGETAVNPEYEEARNDTRRDRVLQHALRYQDSRDKAVEQKARQAELDAERRARQEDAQADRAERAREAAANRADMIRLSASLRQGSGGGGDPELNDLKKADIQSRIDARKAASDAKEEKSYQAKAKLESLADLTAQKADRLAKDAADAVKMVDMFNTGLVGSQVRKIPGTKAFDLQKKIDTIKANIGFETLQEMRTHSPTGGALGQVAIRELDMLQATIANLDTAQDPRTVKENLKKVEEHFAKIAKSMKGKKIEVPSSDPAISAPAPAVQQQAPMVPQAPVAPAAPPQAPSGVRRLRYNPATGRSEPI